MYGFSLYLLVSPCDYYLRCPGIDCPGGGAASPTPCDLFRTQKRHPWVEHHTEPGVDFCLFHDSLSMVPGIILYPDCRASSSIFMSQAKSVKAEATVVPPAPGNTRDECLRLLTNGFVQTSRP